MSQLLDQPIQFFQKHGGMHDAKIISITLDVQQRALVIHMDDVNANFLGLPEYDGKKEAAIIFTEVRNIAMDVDTKKEEILRIYDLDVVKNTTPDAYQLTINCTPGERIRCDFETALLAEKK